MYLCPLYNFKDDNRVSAWSNFSGSIRSGFLRDFLPTSRYSIYAGLSLNDEYYGRMCFLVELWNVSSVGRGYLESSYSRQATVSAFAATSALKVVGRKGAVFVMYGDISQAYGLA